MLIIGVDVLRRWCVLCAIGSHTGRAGMSKEYAAAIEKARQASREFGKAQTAYRLRQMSDAEFLAARALWNASDVEFCAAFLAEEAREDAIG